MGMSDDFIEAVSVSGHLVFIHCFIHYRFIMEAQTLEWVLLYSAQETSRINSCYSICCVLGSCFLHIFVSMYNSSCIMCDILSPHVTTL